ncbi:pumilio homolog 12-like [Coffea arabica]|uniref:Pumilio homolog 12-like n=1 Tax=Coffea arabica TaxID=13443 RepID=A0ABM4WP23_COFAR
MTQELMKYYILDVVADNCLDIATDKSGCCVLQQCVEHARGEPRDRLIAEITANALVLSEHPYGNYVVQFIIGLQIPYITSDILSQLAGNYVSLSMNKYGSNVVEKCMKESSEEQAMQIIKEIIGSQNFLTVLQDPFGNYVAQSAFAIAKGSIRHAMINLIQMHYSYLHSHPHGKRVLARARGSKQRM